MEYPEDALLTAGVQTKKTVYSRQESLRQQTHASRLELRGEAYPMRLNPLWGKKKDDLTCGVSFLTPCTV